MMKIGGLYNSQISDQMGKKLAMFGCTVEPRNHLLTACMPTRSRTYWRKDFESLFKSKVATTFPAISFILHAYKINKILELLHSGGYLF